MDYTFNSEIAKIYGVPEAVFLHNVYWWILKNEANGRHYYEGKHWTYNSMAALLKFFPFWTTDQIRRIIEKLKANGALIINNFNQSPFDRTQWYALSQEIWNVYNGAQNSVAETPNASGENPKSDLAEIPNQMWQNSQIRFGENPTPIPDNKPNSKPDSKPNNKKEKKPSGFDALISEFTDNFDLASAIKDFIKMRTTIKKPLTDRALKMVLNKLSELAKADEEKILILNQSILKCWQDIYPLKIEEQKLAAEKPKEEIHRKGVTYF